MNKEYGLKIKNYETSTILDYNDGLILYPESTKAMFSNSLLLDFLISNGLKEYRNVTRDIVCLSFKWNRKSYEDEKARLEKLLDKAESKEQIKLIEQLLNKCDDNKHKYKHTNRQELRHDAYVNGINIQYENETIHYKMLYRTAGKAKDGDCFFINSKLYERANAYMNMGLNPIGDTDIVGISAYKSLISSTIIDNIKVNPKNILILKDIDSFFKTKVVSIETNEIKQCMAKTIEDYELKNTLFDGQGLIDSSVFPEWADGYILLRQHFCKMACFNTNIQLFFKDYFGDTYETATVEDMWGNKHLAKDIKLITTDNAMKWIKFDISYDYWCDRVNENNDNFGIVKTAHKSNWGELQRMSYQMINSLNMDTMEDVAQATIDYIYELQSNDDKFIQFLKDKSTYSNDYDVLVDLVEQDIEYINSEYFRDRKYAILKNLYQSFQRGKVLNNGDNLTIVGSPYAMLLCSVGEDVEKDNTFNTEDIAIQCYTKRFNTNEYLGAFRNPFNSKNNMNYLHNISSDILDKYFNLGELCIAVNMIHTDFQDRNNSSDQDSDFIMVTNQRQIVECAKECALNYPTIVNNIPTDKQRYSNELSEYAKVDSNLSKATFAIGESSNLAQLALTYTYNFDNPKYNDYVCILSVLAQVAIDNAKRKYDIDLNKEISRIKKDMNIKDNGYPAFWKLIEKKSKFNGAKRKTINKALICPMNKLALIKRKPFRNKNEMTPNELWFTYYNKPMELNAKKRRKIEKLIVEHSILVNPHTNDECDMVDNTDFDKLINDIKVINNSDDYLPLVATLIQRALFDYRDKKQQVKINKNRPFLFKILWEMSPIQFKKCFKLKPISQNLLLDFMNEKI